MINAHVNEIGTGFAVALRTAGSRQSLHTRGGSISGERLALKPQGAGGLPGPTEDKQDAPMSSCQQPAEAGAWESRDEAAEENNILGRRAQNRLKEPVGSPSMGREPLQGQRSALHTEQ